MTKIILTFLGVILCNLIIAQQFKPAIISSGGGLLSNASTKMTFTIGEPVSGIISKGTCKFTQGFQQNWLLTYVGISDILTDNSIAVFPNPTSDIINIKFYKATSEKYIIDLVVINGKTLLNQTIESFKTETQINLSDYPENLYLVRISPQSGKFFHTYKIQKIK